MQFYLGWFAPSKCSFNANDFDSHDIAILELENEVKFSDGNDGTQPVSPICLPKSGEVGLSVTLSSCISLKSRSFMEKALDSAGEREMDTKQITMVRD